MDARARRVRQVLIGAVVAAMILYGGVAMANVVDEISSPEPIPSGPDREELPTLTPSPSVSRTPAPTRTPKPSPRPTRSPIVAVPSVSLPTARPSVPRPTLALPSLPPLPSLPIPSVGDQGDGQR